ncbi:hypothetical protein D3C75_1136160 [compost metagenome]
MWAIAGNHWHKGAFLLLTGIGVSQGVGDGQVRHPFARAKTVLVALNRVDIRFQVDVGFSRWQPHATRIHIDRLQVDGRDLQLVHFYRLASRVLFEGKRRWCGEDPGDQCATD